MATHTDVGDDRESRTGPEPGNLGLLVLNLNTALADQQVYLGSWMEKGKRVGVGIGIPGSWSECGHPEVGEMLRKKGPGMDGLHLPLRESPSQGCGMPKGSGTRLFRGFLTILQKHHQVLATVTNLTSFLTGVPLKGQL